MCVAGVKVSTLSPKTLDCLRLLKGLNTSLYLVYMCVYIYLYRVYSISKVVNVCMA